MNGKGYRGARVVAWLAALALAGSAAGVSPLDGLRHGVNLEGWLDAEPLIPLGNAKLSQLKQIRAAGFDFVRVPVNPALFINAQVGAAEPQASFDRLLGEAKARGLGVVVALAPNDDQKQRVLRGGLARDTYLALLERLAGRVAAAGLSRVLLEPLNEPVDPNRGDCAPSPFNWQAVLSDFVAAVRRGAPALGVLVTGICYADSDSIKDLRPMTDQRVVYGFQYLDPLNFTQQGNPRNDSWKNLKKVPYTTRDAEALRRAFAGVGNWAKQHNVPVLLTSFAVHGSAPAKDRLRWLQDVRTQAEAQHFSWAAWSWESPYGFGLSRGGQLPGDLKRALGLK